MLFFNFCFCSLQKQRSLVSPVEMCHDLLQGQQTAGCDLDQERLDGGICNKHFISIGQTKYLFYEFREEILSIYHCTRAFGSIVDKY